MLRKGPQAIRSGTFQAFLRLLCTEARSSAQPSTSAPLEPDQPEQRPGKPYLLDPQLPVPSFLKSEPVKAKTELTDLGTALQRVQAGVKRRFDETVDVAIKLGTDPRRGDQQVRGATVLPHGTGKSVRVCVFAEGEAAQAATKSGAEVVGSDELIRGIQSGGPLNFDKVLAVPEMMPRLAKVARILGPRGLMPNPKLGTLVSPSGLPAAIRTMKEGRVEYRADKGAVVHAGIGKASFPAEHLAINFGCLIGAVLAARPKGVKGSGTSGYINTINLSSTMGRSQPVLLSSALNAAQSSRRR